MLPKQPRVLLAWCDPVEQRDGLASLVQFPALPVRERVADRLADAMFAFDEVIDMLGEEGASAIRVMDVEVKMLFERVDRLMRQVTD